MKIFKKTIVSLIILITFLNNLVSFANVIEIGDSSLIERGEMGYYVLQYWSEDDGQWMYIVYSRTYYKDKNGDRKIAYCVDPDLDGVGFLPGEYESYYATIDKKLEDQRLWRIYKNGYPNKTAEELGVETDDDAYLATKQAAYCIIRNRTPEFVKTYYRAAEDPIDDQDMEAAHRKGEKVVNLINRLVDIGYNGKETYSESKIEKVGEFIQDDNVNYYSQTYKILGTYDTSFNIKSVSTDLKDVFISDLEGNRKETFKTGESFKVMVEKSNLKEKDSEIEINYEEDVNNYPVYYAKSQIDNKQNYVVLDKNEIKQGKINLKIDANKSSINILKLDKDTNNPMENVEFKVFDEEKNEIGTIVTDEEGNGKIENLPMGKYYIKEILTKDGYVIDEEEKEVILNYNEDINLMLTNEQIKGRVRVIKTSEDDNLINGKKAGDPIEGAKFEIYDDSDNLVDTITSDENGEAFSKRLVRGSYYVKEVESGDWYLLNNDIFNIVIEENDQIVDLDIKNKSEKPGVDIKKSGDKIAFVNQEIKYDFDIKNTGNTDLSNFTWYDYLPYDYSKITKISTGTYNQDINYNIYYKTNKSNEYILLKESLNSNQNNYIDLSNINLGFNEVITEIKVCFGEVKVGFSSLEKPNIYVKTNPDLINGRILRNETTIEGLNKTYKVSDTDDTETMIQRPTEEVKKLPRTGF